MSIKILNPFSWCYRCGNRCIIVRQGEGASLPFSLLFSKKGPVELV